MIGIDLGTSNSAVAFTGDGEEIRVFALPQFFGSGDVRPDPLLPSVLYFPTSHELAAGPLGLPWDRDCPYVVGHLARRLGSRIPGRLIHSAKSWLCHPAADRRAPILPWAAAEGVTHLSPVEVSASYLLYMKEAWDGAHPEQPLEKQEVVLTVPASFDAVARELTMEAAKLAGFGQVTLLEEPQAAFYSWIADHGARWKEALGSSRVLLVCDVGGGTTDFTLVVVTRHAGEVRPVRVAVGDHLLLGGDNMDLALAHSMEVKLAGGPGRLEPEEWGELVHSCRVAKEDLLGRGELETAKISILGRGSGVVGGTRSSKLTRPELEQAVLEGFFPICGPQDAPAADNPLGLKEWGLPYAADPAVTRHLAKFLREAAPAVADALGEGAMVPEGHPVRPDAVLFNGGVFAASALRQRVLDALRHWFSADSGYEPRVLVNSDLGLAVARGAAYYGIARRGSGVRIGGGAARSYYVGLGGAADTMSTVCVVPRGMEEEEVLDIAERRFRLAVGQTVRFPIYASSSRSHDRAGALVAATAKGMVALPALKTALAADGPRPGASEVEVELRSALTPMGTLALLAHAPGTSRAWQLEFDLRPQGAVTDARAQASGPGATREAKELARDMVRSVYGGGRGHPKDPEGLRKRLEQALGMPREDWDTSLLRELWSALDEIESGRSRGPEHEVQWLQMAGWCLRPGFGDPLDPGRVDRLWSIAQAPPRFPRHEANHRALWVMWRRLAPGLDAVRQQSLHEKVRSSLLLGDRRSHDMQGAAASPGVVAEMWRLAASLERLEPQQKIELGERMLALLTGERPPDHGFWVMARLAARHPVTGAVRQVVPREVAQRWVPLLVRLVRAHGERASFAIAHAARKTGDRNRDLSEGQRREVLARMEQLAVPPRHVQLIAEVIHLGAAEQGALLGDSVPPGLSLAD
ncbi:MAG: Hsp70 family protein [Candidatus Wallbacteria bacterium]|nr:Hsp70 family protein [Candidatus Wallbacteria bacterium]